MPGVTREQIDRAKEWDLLSYLQTYEPGELTKKRPTDKEYRTKTHDSLVISNGRWNWTTRGFGGKTALDYLIKVRGMEFVEAVRTLNDGRAAPSLSQPVTRPPEQPRAFALPEGNRCATAAVSYLQRRGIDSEIISRCIRAGIFFESRKYHNCVFVGRDKAGKARFACLRGTMGDFKGDVPGSDKRFNFCFPAGGPSRTVAVFESPIDALSLATLFKARGVATWDRGNTYPDISLLPAIARLLKIDMNELFSFREELTEKEIGQFVNELSEVSLDSFIKAFEMGKNKIKEYPHCDSLIYSIATVLNAALTLSDVDDEKKLECNNVIVEWLERTAESPNEKVRISSIFMLAAKYIQMEKYKEANIFLDKIPDTVIDGTIMKTNVLAHQEGTDIAAFFLEGKLMQTVTNIQNYLYKLIEMEEETGNHCKAEEIAEITEHMVSLFGLWDYGKVVPHLLIAGYRKDVEKCIQLIKEVLMESQKPWKMVESPLYYRYADTVQGKSFSGVGNNFVRALATEIENKEEYEFLKGNKELEAIFSQYLK